MKQEYPKMANCINFPQHIFLINLFLSLFLCFIFSCQNMFFIQQKQVFNLKEDSHNFETFQGVIIHKNSSNILIILFILELFSFWAAVSLKHSLVNIKRPQTNCLQMHPIDIRYVIFSNRLLTQQLHYIVLIEQLTAVSYLLK